MILFCIQQDSPLEPSPLTFLQVNPSGQSRSPHDLPAGTSPSEARGAALLPSGQVSLPNERTASICSFGQQDAKKDL